MEVDASLAGAPRTDRFVIREKIGEGAMGLVFRALDREIDRDVALKSLRRASPDDLLTLKREFRALADIRHPNLVELMELFADGESCFISMEWIDGCEFSEFARPTENGETKRAPISAIRNHVRQLVLGLERLHRSGTLHQDVKPSNVMVDRTGRVVLLDFGLVGAFGIDRTPWSSERSVAGTFDYMAPEQAWGEPGSPASDLYGVGAMLYEALTGELPYSGARLARLLSGRSEAPPAPHVLDASVPVDLSDLTMALLAVDPDVRPSTADVLGLLQGEAGGGAAHQSDPVGGALAVDQNGLVAESQGGPFLGRATELAQLRRAWGRARDGQATVVRVAGVSGIGKTRLMEQFIHDVEGHGDIESRALVLRSRCTPEESVRFKAVDGLVDELSRYLAARPQDVTVDLDLIALTRVFPVLAGTSLRSPDSEASVDEAEPHVVRTRAFRALRALLGEIARHRPVVLWIDDLQWGDVDSIPLLSELIRGEDAPGLLLVLSYRGGEGGPVLGALEEDRTTWGESEQIVLGPLDEIDGRALVDALLGPRHEEFAGAAHPIPAEAGGSPFFIGELSRLLLQGESIDGGGTTQSPMLAEVVGRRVRQLPEAAQRLLEVVSVSAGPLDRSMALRAADLDESDRTLVKDLRVQSLIKVGADGKTHPLEPYHDQIREQILASVTEERRARLHRVLLGELEAAGDASAERLLHHAHGCGELVKASRHAERAGDQAAEALAFVQAAVFYRDALAWTTDTGVARASLLARRAEALVNAGQGLEAAPLYLEAADLGREGDALVWRGRAAEQLLVSGGIERGLGVLEPLLDELGIRFPASERQAIAWNVGLIARLLVRGIRFKTVDEARLPLRDRARIDLCFSASKGLVAVDTPRGGYLALRGLMLALRAGEPRRVGRSLAMVAGAVLAPAGGLLLRRARKMVARTESLGRSFDDDYLRGIADITRGQIAVFEGKWREALERSDRGIETLTHHCRGVTWEVNTGQTGVLRGLEELGQYDELLRRSRDHAVRSSDRGDLYGEIVAAAYLAIGLIADACPQKARAQHRAAFRRWHHGRFDVQSLYALRAEIMADAYEMNADVAQEKLDLAWPEIEAAMLLRVPVTRIDSILMRARLAVQRAAECDGPDRDLLDSVERDADRLEREKRADARAHAAALRAAISHQRGELQAMRQHLDRAESGYADEGMVVYAVCMRAQRHGEIDADQLGELSRRGVREPARWASLIAPGFKPLGSRSHPDRAGIPK